METRGRIPYLGFGLYWAWVYLSFNSLQITGNMSDGAPFIPLLHIISGFSGCLVFILVIAFHKRIEKSPHFGVAIWMAAMVTAQGTLFYTLPFIGGTQPMAIAGAIVSGLASPWIALSWGLAYCRLDARSATGLTAGSFLMSGVAYVAISYISQPISGTLVAFMPVLSVLALYVCSPAHFMQPSSRSISTVSVVRELSTMFVRTGSGRIITGIFMTMFVCGGLRIYIMQLQSSVYSQPLLVALPIALVALVFLGYSTSVSSTSLNLGPLYRIAMPLFALAFVIIAMFGAGNTDMSFLIVSAGATLIDMLTWVLLIEIARSTHFSTLLVLAVGRCAIHLGMAAGEATALFLFGSMTVFFIVSIVILMIAAGYMFADRDTTFFFEPPMESELSDGEGRQATLDGRIRAIADDYGLSPRETEVFTLWATGYGSKAIEEKLVVSPATVKTHLHHIYEKCDVHSRAEILDLIDTTR
jgi:DNA-binding CsgD family transcriptional regulator